MEPVDARELALGVLELGLESCHLGELRRVPVERGQDLPVAHRGALLDRELHDHDCGQRRPGNAHDAARGLEPPERRDARGLGRCNARVRAQDGERRYITPGARSDLRSPTRAPSRLHALDPSLLSGRTACFDRLWSSSAHSPRMRASHSGPSRARVRSVIGMRHGSRTAQ
jgi:hypothetical protein